MAERSAVMSQDNLGRKLVIWSGLANSDTGAKVNPGIGHDFCAQCIGTFGSGGTVTWEGSMDGTNWNTLQDRYLSGDITQTTSKPRSLDPLPLYVRPHVTAGDGTTSLVAYIIYHAGE